MTDRRILCLIDADGYIHRAFHALPLTSSRGEPVGALFGFARMLLKVLKERRPDRIAVCFDTRKPTFRHKKYPEYKAHRKEIDDALKFQLPFAYEMASLWGLPTVRLEGWEADDIVASLAARGAEEGMDVLVVSGDKDVLQLVDDRIKVLNEAKGIVFDVAEVEKKYGLKPVQLVDYFALVGDASDNVPGVTGVGEKGALALLKDHGSLDNLYRDLEKVKPNLKERLAEQKDVAYLSRELVTLDRKAPVGIDPESCVVGPPSPQLIDLLRRFEFGSLISDITKGAGPGKESSPAKKDSAEAPRPPAVAVVNRVVRTVLTEDDLSSLVKALKNAEALSVDVETTGTDSLSCALVGIALSAKAGEGWYVPLGHRALGEPAQLPLGTVQRELGPILADERIPKRGQNLKFDLQVLERHGMPVGGIAFDTLVASYCLNPSRLSHGLKVLARDILGEDMTPIEALIGSGKSQITMDQVPLSSVAGYAAADAEVAFRLADRMGPELKEKGMERLFHEVEMPLVRILAGMEKAGIALDRPFLEELRGRFRRELAELEKGLHELAGSDVNLNSPKQLAFLLFQKLGLPTIKKTKTGFSTDEDVLQKLSARHPFPAKLLEYRGLSKLVSTYVDGLLASVSAATGRVHCRFNQAVAATGRLSSSEPNMQNIPIRTEHGRSIRRAFVPSEGRVFFAADYSQIDLRVLAHMSGDKALGEAFRKGEDVHSATARDIFGLAPGEPVPEDRRRIAKTVNFGIIYGQTPYGLSQQLGIPTSEAKSFIDAYMARYPGVTRWMEDTVARARKEGYVTTLLQRRRYLPEIHASNAAVRGFAERTAVNTPIQGTSADIIKVAMRDIARLIEEKGWKTKMLLQVHDDLLFEVPAGELDEVAPAVKRVMETAVALDVPVVADLKKGVNWAEMEKF